MKHGPITRRDFLKLLATAGLLAPISKFSQFPSKPVSQANNLGKPNIIILLFDTLSARHMSLYGYERNTTPNIANFSKKSTVFHRNYSSSNFTQSSTASLFTGVYPWSHRSLDFYTPLLKRFEKNNIFSDIDSDYHTIAYTHNVHVEDILVQFRSDIDTLKPIGDLVVYDETKYRSLFNHDRRLGTFAAKNWIETFPAPSHSLILDSIFTFYHAANSLGVSQNYKSKYPLGMTNFDGRTFILEDAIDWISQAAVSTPQPYFGYFHLLPPHAPFRPRADFYGMFAKDKFKLPEKPEHHFTQKINYKKQNIYCQWYDEYIAHVDAEFGRLIQQLDRQGLLDNSYLFLTSDHGELFERGIHGHATPAVYESVIHTPLIVRAPGQTEGANIYSPTNIVDIYPTLLSLTGQQPPDDCEGVVLPTLGDSEDHDRIIFSMYTQQNAAQKHLTKVTYSAIKWPYKLITYKGYSDFDNIDELFNLDEDPEELNNLTKHHPSIVADLKDELRNRQSEAEEKYLGSANISN